MGPVDAKSEEFNIDSLAEEVHRQFGIVFDAKDSLDQKVQSFIGFNSVFFGLLLGILITRDTLSIFDENNIWTLTINSTFIFIFLTISLLCSFMIIFGYPQYMGPDLGSLYKSFNNGEKELKRLVIIEYVEDTYKNAIKTQDMIRYWQLAVFFSFLTIVALGLGLLNIAFIFWNPSGYFLALPKVTIIGYLSPVILLFTMLIGVRRITTDIDLKKRTLEELIREWNEILTEEGY